MTAPEKNLMKKEELIGFVEGLELTGKDVFITLGAGDIDRLTGPLAEILKKKIDR